MSKKWLLFIGFVVVLCIGEYVGSSPNITQKQFEVMFLNNQVKRVSYVINKGVVEFELRRGDRVPGESRQNEKGLLSIFRKSNPTVYSFRIPSITIFNERFKELEAAVAAENRIGYDTIERFSFLSIVYELLSFVGIMLLLVWLFRSKNGGNPFIMTTSTIKLYDKNKGKVTTFKDIAGLHEVKQEISEVIDFLRNRNSVEKIGGKIPKGVLLVGPPGNGKTLLAKAMAGEANVPFFSMSGADFVEMYVGMGAARVRKLFQQARMKAPCVVFIDELDAIGRSRRKTLNGGNEEQENTLNALLVEMDGFQDNVGIVVVGATNRIEILDDALLRPGRFDRQVAVDNPHLKDREEIFDLYIKKIKVDKSIDVHVLAEQTTGFSAAEIANMCNEAALLAVRGKKKNVSWVEMQEAMDRIIGGIEKKSKVLSIKEKEIVAYHEAGHTIVSWFLEYAQPLLKVSIVPRGLAALGYAQYTPKEQYLTSEEELFDEICTLLGGRIAEKIVFNKISTGAANDLKRSTSLAYKMVMVYGMSNDVGVISYSDFFEDPSCGGVRPYSNETAKRIDEGARFTINEASKRVEKLLTDKISSLKLLATQLLENEVIYRENVERIIGKREFVE